VGANSLLGDQHHTRVVEVFSTITSPVFSELVILVASHTVSYLPRDITLFETLRKVNNVRPLKLVFSADIMEIYQEGLRRELAEALGSVVAKGFLDFLDSPPTIR